MDKAAQMFGKIACFLFLVAIFIIGKYTGENKTKYSSNLNGAADSVNISDYMPAVEEKETLGNYTLTTSTTVVNLRNLGPFDFLPNHKNPCWRRIESIKTLKRCIPYFYLIGCEKCGSSDLWYRLVQHPEIAATDKENFHWISKTRFHGLPFEFYLDWFQAAVEGNISKTDSKGYHPMIIGDGNPSMNTYNEYWMLDPANHDTFLEPHFTNADNIYFLNPKAKIIAILREPVERLFSEYNYFARNQTSAKFHGVVSKMKDLFEECRRTHTDRYCVNTKKPEQSSIGQIWKGLYYVHLGEFYRVFPKEQILVLKLDDCKINYDECLHRTFKFLEIFIGISRPLPNRIDIGNNTSVIRK
ncbi:carbohydrate sulfotransferase 15-like isoform X2 [Mya arenaria]|uniref:carbohydrate sulfotransferase 15-like isoform X2 n=2 Tax=Mya arenaria TaxID=6604 RepID=UPI0022E8EE21|nr:carbohydrate sulfotransferase 15-like isoform X2 [Mya arenaria]